MLGFCSDSHIIPPIYAATNKVKRMFEPRTRYCHIDLQVCAMKGRCMY